ncbi:MAG: 16S rRNA (guanine(966)-N(2))-methyltransferase RsmD [Candidatus Omnitrophica bacterium]|nr:16S rRNA (guanine(966)-N(2))-methyltransferase RsmD [Candidatus Omnitrophota bacterium]
MKVITGKYKGRVIRMPKGIRPTQQKVRKALFDILGDIKGVGFLELFAGSGAIGIEALSKGAREVVFVERDKRCVSIIKKNLSLLGYLSCKVISTDVLKAIQRLNKEGRSFEVIFSDPPYYQDLAKKTLQTLSIYDILAPNGLLIIEHFNKEILPDQAGDLRLFKQNRYGDTLLSFYKKSL